MAALPPHTVVIFKNGNDGVEKPVKRGVATLDLAFHVKTTVKKYVGGKRTTRPGPKYTPFCMWPHPGEVAAEIKKGRVPKILVFNLYEGNANEKDEVASKEVSLDNFQKDFPLEDATMFFWTPGMYVDVLHPDGGGAK